MSGLNPRPLQTLLDTIDLTTLPPAWTAQEWSWFSRQKSLWDYQQAALQQALKLLWFYYQHALNYRPGEADAANAHRKQALLDWYGEAATARLNFDLTKMRRDVHRLLQEYFPVDGQRLAFQQVINRMNFWMATGSGKTLVLVKLLEMLWRLMRRGEVPPHDVLVLTCRDDLLQQIRAHVDEFNASHPELHLRLVDLRDHPAHKREFPEPATGSGLTVFVYRSDNLGDAQKEKIVDFRNYDNGGRWFVLLDEAHKGDREDSKRQHIYSILARNGFLFNFSATFTDPRDLLTTAFDFNLARFIEAGYGKHIAVMQSEFAPFRSPKKSTIPVAADFTGDEKQKIVLASLMLLAHLQQAHERLQSAASQPVYHNPLMLVLVNSVNVEQADLKVFFETLARIARGEVSERLWQEAREQLLRDGHSGAELVFERGRPNIDVQTLSAIAFRDVLSRVFQAESPGSIEALVRPSNRQEIALKLKTAPRPFALIRIGDISGWLQHELAGYEISTVMDGEAFFDQLNTRQSDIRLLMGSRSFYEGWDSNRPNVITFINIGVGADARKFLLQAIGRGVRIEPVPGQRRRLAFLPPAAAQLNLKTATPDFELLETLFLFATSRATLTQVLRHLDQEKRSTAQVTKLEPPLPPGQLQLPFPQDEPRFPIQPDELQMLQSFVHELQDDRLLLALFHLSPRQIARLHQYLRHPERYFTSDAAPRYGRLPVLMHALRQFLPAANR
ncbi:MAG: DEAD/DEAH box helicase family protein [candidate division KSB1 bacterium]|nr:DEAD/DEAH box helicase family protein [candidate division KSB1 bacterium]